VWSQIGAFQTTGRLRRCRRLDTSVPRRNALLLVVPLLLRPSLDVSLLPPRRSPRRQTGNRRRCHLPRPPSLACATKPRVNQCHARRAQHFIIRPLFGSASCWTCRSLDMGLLDFKSYVSLCLFCLDLSLFLLAFAPCLCHQTSIHAAPFDPAPLLRLDIPFTLACSSIRRTLLSIRRRAVCRRQNIHSFFFPFADYSFPSRSTHCLIVSDSIYIPKPSPGESQATVARLSLAFTTLSDQLATPSTNTCAQQWG